ncbi:MAG: hypothetical protein AB1791_18720 [Chloroflexota bacterium]
MAKVISEREESSVRLLRLEVTEDELALLVACLDFTMDEGDDEILENICGAYRDEVEGIREDLDLALHLETEQGLSAEAQLAPAD